MEKIASPEFNQKIKKKKPLKRLSKSSNNSQQRRNNFTMSNNNSIELPNFNIPNDISYENNIQNGDIFQLNKNDKPSCQTSMDHSFLYMQQKINQNNYANRNLNLPNHNIPYDTYPYLKQNEIPYQNINLNTYKDNSQRAITQLEPFDLIKLLLKQYDFFLQILIQNVLLTSDQGLKYRCYSLLFSFYMTREKIINTVKLPEYTVYFNFCRVKY
jgi:hypothetical protein